MTDGFFSPTPSGFELLLLLLVTSLFVFETSFSDDAFDDVDEDASSFDFFESGMSSLWDRLRTREVAEAGDAGGSEGGGGGGPFSPSLFGDPLVDEVTPPRLFDLRPFFPFFEDEEEVDIDEFRPWEDDPPAAAVAEEVEFIPENITKFVYVRQQ
jgi:hypothetical protein